MTARPPHPQKYIITEEQVQEIELKINITMAEEIRSRPHSSPAAEPVPEIRGFVMIDRQRDFVLWLQEHDEQIQQQAAAKGRKELFTDAEIGHMVVAIRLNMKGKKCNVCESAVSKLESLRGKQPEQRAGER